MPVITRKYPTNYFVGNLAGKQKKTDIYSKYTTASSFRNKTTTSTQTQPPAASKEIKSDQKYFNADAIKIKVPSFSVGGNPMSYKDKLLTQGMIMITGY